MVFNSTDYAQNKKGLVMILFQEDWKKYPTAIANRKRSFKVANGVLTTYEVTFQREAA